ncbi:MAG: hypothetical protein HY645_09155 [Acidobacteria bacterium]|nr:hypothetical protein [Acidobacteriota bacterium]
MSSHWNFEESEAGQGPDPQHLTSCEECRRKWQLAGFLRHQLSAAQAPEPTPFFASRVASLAVQSNQSFSFWFATAARKLTPVFLALLIVASGAVLFLSPSPSESYAPVDLIFSRALDQEPGEVSLEDVFNALTQVAEEEPFGPTQ